MTQILDGASQAFTTDSGVYEHPETIAGPRDVTSAIIDPFGASILSVPLALLLRGVPRAAITGGMLLGTSTSEITAELYRLSAIGTLVNILDNSLSRAWQDWLGEPGAGSLTLMNDDTDLASIVGDADDLVLFKYRNQRAFMIVLEQFEKVSAAPGEEAKEAVTWGGRGHLALLERMVVYPSGGVGRIPIQEDRYFNWTALEFDDSSWAGASVITTVAVAQTIWGGGGNVWDPEFPDTTAAVLGPASATPLDAPVGSYYLRQTFTITTAGKYGLYLLVDNHCQIYIDGQLIGQHGQSAEMTGFQQSFTEVVELSTGTHLLAIVATNHTPIAAGNNPTGVAWALYVPGSLGQVGTLIAHSNTSAKIVAYPSEAPGMTPGEALGIVLDEGVARGVLPALTRSFTDLVDSEGAPWPVAADIATKVGNDVLSFMRELATYMEVDLSPGQLVLNAYNVGGRGIATTITLARGVNLESLHHRGEVGPSTVLLLRYFNGWAERTSNTGTYGRREATLSVGALDALPEVYRVADGQLGLFAAPREQVDAGLNPSSDSEQPYLAFHAGDTMTVPRASGSSTTERLLSITISEDVDRVVIELSLRDVIIDVEARFAQQVKKMSDRALLGRTAAAQPASFNPF